MDKIHKRIKSQSDGLAVDHTKIAMQTISGLYDGVSSEDIDSLAARNSASMIKDHPDYSKLAGRLVASRLQKNTPATFGQCFKEMKDAGLLNPFYIKKVNDYGIKNLNEIINNDLDLEFTYFGIETLKRSYLTKVNGKIVERPQYLYLREAICVTSSIEEAKEYYGLFANHFATHATPTLFNCGMQRQQLSSCFLLIMESDSIEGINKTIGEIAKISANGGGIGLCISNIRARGSKIKGLNGVSNGILPLLKVLNENSRYWLQGSDKRKGSFAVYLDVWHKDIYEFLDIRKNTGKDEIRARDLFTALNSNDLFMNRVKDEQNWTLFCPNEVLLATGKNLWDCYGAEFEELYIKCEGLGIGTTIKARDLWAHICETQIETGTPFLHHKDASNRNNNQSNVGVIKSLNLCMEIAEVASAELTAVCNLASIALPKCIITNEEGKLEFDHSILASVSYKLVYSLNNIIEANWYPDSKTKRSNKQTRPIAIGVQGLADVFAMLKMPFDSEEAKQLNKEIFETIYYYSLVASNNLAKEFGKYNYFEGSPLSKGLFQFNLGNNPLDESKLKYKDEWAKLRESIMTFGVRNSLLVGLMPTASTSQIMDNNECFEGFTSNLYSRKVLSNTFTVINKHMVKDLIELNLWNNKIRNSIIANNGSVQLIPEIPQEIKDRYKTIYEISQRVVIDMARDRGYFVDQAQSMNLFVKDPNLGKLTSMHFYAWEQGLKTGIYYLRSGAAVDPNKNLGIEIHKKEEVSSETLSEQISCSLDNPQDCEACGS
jgi:ribonucleoside-diphosphate reductase alpha chain